MDTEGWEGIWQRLLLVVSERTGVPREDVEAVLDAEHEFWVSRPRLLNIALSSDDDEEV